MADSRAGMLFYNAADREAHRALKVRSGGGAEVTVGELYDELVDAGGQEQLIATLGEGTPEQALRFFSQLAGFHVAYPGGVRAYVAKARELLLKSQRGENEFEGMVPSVPDGEKLRFLSDEYVRAERAGMDAAKDAAFVLVAGGMGERLGYNGIKVSLPVETTSGRCYLEQYMQSMRALGSLPSAPPSFPPFAIMTSDETHAKTLSLLESNDYFGYPREKVTLLKQDKVPCLATADARLATDPNDPYTLLSKPHGHGDVHLLLHTSGLARKWLEQDGKKWIAFFQDTNGLVFHSMSAALGISSMRDFDANSIAVPRLAKASQGAIVRLEKEETGATAGAISGSSITCNVEYNLLDPMLRAANGGTTFPNGDVNLEDTEAFLRFLEI